MVQTPNFNTKTISTPALQLEDISPGFWKDPEHAVAAGGSSLGGFDMSGLSTADFRLNGTAPFTSDFHPAQQGLSFDPWNGNRFDPIDVADPGENFESSIFDFDALAATNEEFDAHMNNMFGDSMDFNKILDRMNESERAKELDASNKPNYAAELRRQARLDAESYAAELQRQARLDAESSSTWLGRVPVASHFTVSTVSYTCDCFWLSDILSSSLGLVYPPALSRRPVRPCSWLHGQ